MRVGVTTMLLSMAVVGAACSLFVAKETRYLESAQDHASQDEVREQLGKPHYDAGVNSAGESVLVYHVYEEEPFSLRWGTSGTWCDEYVLTFDKDGILRGWTHKSEGHGGELMPTYCVTDDFIADS